MAIVKYLKNHQFLIGSEEDKSNTNYTSGILSWAEIWKTIVFPPEISFVSNIICYAKVHIKHNIRKEFNLIVIPHSNHILYITANHNL